MKSPLRLKFVVVLGYVVLCTVLVLINQSAEAPWQGGPLWVNLSN